jgi:DnaJ family protein C protein 10
MNGIIKIGAVNCAEDPHLCQSQHVRAYPSLVAYPDHSFFQGRRDIDSFVEFITSKLRVELIQVTSRNVESLSMQWEPYSTRPWLIDFCDEMENCFKEANRSVICLRLTSKKPNFRRLIAHMLQGIVNIGTVMCHVENKDKLCEELLSEGLAYYPAGNISKKHQKEIDTLDLIAVHQNVLRLLPDIPVLDEDNYRNLLDRLDEPKKEDLLVLFTAQKSDAKDELKKLSAFSTNFRLAECTKLADGCEGMRLGPLPKLVYFRPEGHYLIYYGKTIELGDVRSFVVSAKKSTMISMTENYFDEIKQKQEESASNDIWLVDMFAPWCHPCMLALNELNALPIELNGRRLRVGIIDCDIHKQVCQNNGVSR